MPTQQGHVDRHRERAPVVPASMTRAGSEGCANCQCNLCDVVHLKCARVRYWCLVMWHQIGFPLSPHNQNDEFRVFDISDIDASISWVIHEANRDEAGDTLPRSSDTREHVGYSEFIVNPIHRPQ